MKVDAMSKEALEKELKKTIKVMAVGESDIYVGYYNHLRRRGGDVFIIKPIIRERFVKMIDPVSKREINSKKKEKVLITAEQQISERWMVRVKPDAKVNMPAHFNEVGRGKKRLNIPGMNNKVGTDDKNLMNKHDNPNFVANNDNEFFDDNTPSSPQDGNVI